MALLFSAVKVTAGDDETELLVGGIPREYDDLEGWTIFDNFRLYYYGATDEDIVSDVEEVVLPIADMPMDVYSITGVRVRTSATTLEGLPAGIYIVGGHKILVK